MRAGRVEINMSIRHRQRERGQALIETAIMVPILLMVMVGIFEVGRAYQTYQVVTNAAREGARMSVTPNSNKDTAIALVKKYLADGQLDKSASASVVVDNTATMTVNGTTHGASLVTVDYPFQFIMLQPVVRLVSPKATVGGAITMHATSMMRNEAQ
jgi:Flp pilus assembly protein TadG